MAYLNCLGLLFLFITLAKCDIRVEQWEPKDLVRTKLENKLSSLRASENEVTDVKPKPKVEMLKALDKTDYPVAFRGEEPSCPDFHDVMNDLKTSIAHLTQLANATISIFTETFNKPEYQCKLSLNPLNTIKCFVRVLAASYRQISIVWTEANSFTKDISKMMIEYRQYSTKCNKNWTLGNTLQLVDLFKLVEGYIKDA